MYNKFNHVGDSTIAAGGSDSSLSIDFTNIKNAKVGVLIVYDAVDSPTGCKLRLVPGTGNSGPASQIGPRPSPQAWKRFATPDDNTTTMAILAAPVLISDVTDPLNGKFVSFTELTIVEQEVPRFMNLQFANDDGTNGAKISVYLDS